MQMKKKCLLVSTLLLIAVLTITAAAADDIGDRIGAVRAVDFTDQGGYPEDRGPVQFPTDRAYPTLSYWDYRGHWLEWDIDIPADELYIPVVMYGTNREYTDRQLSVDGEFKIDMLFFSTGDFRTYKIGYFEPLELTAGVHTIRIIVSAEAGVHSGVNPAWIAFVPFEVLMEADDQQIITAVERKLGF